MKEKRIDNNTKLYKRPNSNNYYVAVKSHTQKNKYYRQSTNETELRKSTAVAKQIAEDIFRNETMGAVVVNKTFGFVAKEYITKTKDRIEIANLRVNNVVNAENEVLDAIALDKTQTKGNKAQTVYVGKALKKEITVYLKKFPHLLKNKEGNLIKTQKGKTTSATIQYIFKQLYALANIPNATSHSGRRNFITELSEKGVSVRVIQELARHSSLQTTQRYIDVSVPKLKGAVDLIGA
ncbi:MAG: site-specific integrase [SAR86 cluster bacterium]|nr:site-specific integrase [SAR86 cluster bacterium]